MRTQLISIALRHWCPKVPGVVAAHIEIRGRDRESAVSAVESEDNMRRNKFNEAYCTTADEVGVELDRHDYEPKNVYGQQIGKDSLDDDECIEIVGNQDGETVCFVEARTLAECLTILETVGIEFQ